MWNKRRNLPPYPPPQQATYVLWEIPKVMSVFTSPLSLCLAYKMGWFWVLDFAPNRIPGTLKIRPLWSHSDLIWPHTRYPPWTQIKSLAPTLILYHYYQGPAQTLIVVYVTWFGRLSLCWHRWQWCVPWVCLQSFPVHLNLSLSLNSLTFYNLSLKQ